MSGASEVNILYDPIKKMACPFCRGHVDTSATPAFENIECPACHRSMVVPARLGSFILLDLLGHGGMGGVFRAHDESLGRDVAIKVMLKSLGDNQEFVQNFRREAQAAAKLNHPHIAQIYSFGTEKGQPYIVMELVGGKHFDKMISAENPLDPALVMRIGADIADGLKMAAEVGLVHGDIKPENILLDERDQAKLLDFGLASTVNQTSDEIWGTPYYIAPEKVRRQKTDHRSDIYCLGGTLYHALAGIPPFDGADAVAVVKARFMGPPKPLREIRPDIPQEVADIIDRMLQLEPGRRYPTYDSLLGDMRRYVSSAAPASTSHAKRAVIIKGKRKPSESQQPAAIPAAPSEAITGEPSQTASMSQGPASGRHGKIVISRGTSAHVSSNISSGTSAPVSADGSMDSTAGETQAPQEKNYTLVILLSVVISVIGLAVLGGGITWFVIHSKHQKEEAAQAEAAATLKKAKDGLSDQVKRFEKVRDEIGKSEAERAAIIAETEKVVLAELAVAEGEDIASKWNGRIALPPLEPEPEIEEAVAEEDSNAEEAAEAKPDDEAKGESVEADATTDEKPAADSGEAAEEVAEESSAEETSEEIAEEPVEEEVVPELVTLAREVCEAGRVIEQANLLAQKKLSFPASDDLATLASQTSDARDRADELLKAANRLGAAITKMKGKLGDIKAKIEIATAQRERDAEAAAVAKHEAEEEEARAAAAAAYARLIESEKQKVLAQEAGQAELVGKFDFRAPLRVLRNLDERLDTPEAKELLAQRIDRIEYLSKFKDFLVEKLAAGDFRAPKGWTVTAADAREITVNGKNQVRWANLEASQVVPMINFYLLDEKNVKNLKLREREDASFGAAIYCLNYGGGSDSAKAMAQSLVDKIIAIHPTAEKEARRIFTELNFD